MPLLNWEADNTCSFSIRNNLEACLGTTLEEGPGSRTKSQRKGMFRFGVRVFRTTLFPILLICVSLRNLEFEELSKLDDEVLALTSGRGIE